MSPGAEAVTFELQHMQFGEPGRLEVSGRWYGVRGRRFVRPTLTLKLRADGSERRVLADLEHKPWAAEDGDEWVAAFPLELALDEATEFELAVAPDITVALSSDGTGQAEQVAEQARAPRIRTDPVRHRPRERSPEAERLRERLTSAEEAIARERAKRQGVEETLEDERRELRRLRAELGRIRAELELAATVQRELDSATTQLDRLRGELRETSAQRETAEHELTEQRRGLEIAQRQLTDAEAAVKRLTTASEAGHEFGREFGEPGARPPRPRPERAVGNRPAPERHVPAPPRTERPLNPSLRRGGWIVRGLAVIVMLIVIAAIVLVIRSTVG